MTAFSFWQTLVSHALAWGGGYAEIVRDGTGRPVALWPLDPTTVQPWHDPKTISPEYRYGKLVYRVQLQAHSYVVLQQTEILHMHGLSFDGICGYDLASIAKEAVGNLLASYRYSGSFFGTGTNTGGLLTTSDKIDAKALENLRSQMQQRYSGAENGHRIMILDKGFQFQKMTSDPQKSMMIESMAFGVQDIARIFRIPPSKLGDHSHSTFSNIEELNQNYIDETLSGWSVGITQECKRKLLLPSERGLDIKHDFTDMLKGDSEAQADYFGKLFLNGFISQNEVCRRLNLPQQGPDGDKYYRPANIVPVEEPDPVPAVLPDPQNTPKEAPQAPPSDDPGARAASTHITLLASTLRRLLRIEQEKIQRFRPHFGAEHKIQEFYQNHGNVRFGDVVEILESFRQNAKLTFDSKAEANDIIKRHVERSLNESKDCLLVDGWLGARADEFAKNEIQRLMETRANG